MPEEFVAIDLETTGLNSAVDEITEIGATRFDRDGNTEQYETLVNPGRLIPREIQKLTGISDDAVANAPRFEKVASALTTFVGNRAIVGQNIKFDLTFLARSGIEFPGPCYDTWEIASVLLPTADRLNLATLAELLEIPARGAHRALADAETTRDVFLALLDRFEELPLELLSELYEFAIAGDWSTSALIADAISRLREKALKNQSEFTPIRRHLRQPKSVKKMDVLLPSDEPDKISAEEISQVFETISRRPNLFSNYELRTGQITMAETVANQLGSGGEIAIEAGTGTGKSLAYLLPALMHAKQNSDRVVVSTHTINLQEQLAEHDVPLAIRLISATTGQSGDIDTAVLKGRNNYLCLERWNQVRLEAKPRNEAEARLFGRIAHWLPTTESGDVAELYMTSDERGAWARLSADETDCLSRRCSFVQDGSCFLLRARQRAAGSHVVIVNHALLLANASRDDQLLPSFRHLIVDEAHRLEDVATQHFSSSISVRDVRDLLDRIGPNARHGNPGLVRRLRKGEFAETSALSPLAGFTSLADEIEPTVMGCRDVLKTLADIFREFARDQFTDQQLPKRYVLPLTRGVRAQPQWDDIEDSAMQLDLALQVIVSRLSSVAETLGNLTNIVEAKVIRQDALEACSSAEQLRTVLTRAVLQRSKEDVSWMTITDGDLRVNVAPLDVAPLLQAELFANRESILATSATLQTENSFDFILGRIGLTEADSLVTPSPFNFERAVLTLVVDDLPDPGMPGYDFALHEVLADATLAAGGRTLSLFTSHAALRIAAETMREYLTPQDIRVLAQRIDGSPARLLRLLKEQPKSMIMGTSAFWEGIDVPGDDLSQIVIARLPFPVPTDPVYAGRAESFEDPFTDFALPQAVLRFRQGFGRLIRRATDRGIFLIADSRIARRDYGTKFLESLPDTEVRHIKADDIGASVSDWLER